MSGWKLVPIEPTEEMVNAAEDYMEFIDTTGEVWEAMLAAAPPASQDEELVERIAFVLCEYDEENPGTCGCGGRCTNTHSLGQARAVLKMLEADHG